MIDDEPLVCARLRTILGSAGGVEVVCTNRTQAGLLVFEAGLGR
ncbi:hypothetical protein [Nonomuraea sp. NPDC005650]